MPAINNKIQDFVAECQLLITKYKTLYNVTCKIKGAVYSYNENTGALQTILKHTELSCALLVEHHQTSKH